MLVPVSVRRSLRLAEEYGPGALYTPGPSHIYLNSDIIILMLHPSRIFSGLLITFIISVFISLYYPIQNQIMPYLILAAVITILFFWKVKIIRYIALVAFFALIGIWRTGEVIPNDKNIWVKDYIGSEIKTEGRIIEEPKTSGVSQQITVSQEGIKGNLQISTNQFPGYHFGDALIISGKITDLDSDSEQYRGYFKSQQIYAFARYPKIEKTDKKYSLVDNWYFIIRKPLIEIRLKYEDVISKVLPEPEAGLLSGIILGQKTSLSDEFLAWLSITGTIHIIALSGYNITIVAEAMRIMSKRLSRRISFWLPVIGILSFLFATGLSSSVIRAAIMGVVMLLAKKLGRTSNALISILFASSLMIFANPYILVYDVGFQLSFAAVSGILFFAPKIEKYFSIFGRTFGQIIAATVAAQLFSWPITSLYFGVVSVISPLANLLIIPLVPFVMLLGFIAASIGIVSLWLGNIVGFLSWVILAYFVKVIEILAKTSYAALNYKISSEYFIIGYYLVLFDIIMILSKRRKNGCEKTL